MLDTNQDYYFVPSSYPEVQVVPGKVSNNNCATVTYGGATHNACASGNTQGGFFIVAIDRLLGNATDQYTLPTNSTNPSVSKQAISDLAYLFRHLLQAQRSADHHDVWYSDRIERLRHFGSVVCNHRQVGRQWLSTAETHHSRLHIYTDQQSGYRLCQNAHYPVESSTASGGTGHWVALFCCRKDRSQPIGTEHWRFGPDVGLASSAFSGPRLSFSSRRTGLAWHLAGEQAVYLDLTSFCKSLSRNTRSFSAAHVRHQ